MHRYEALRFAVDLHDKVFTGGGDFIEETLTLAEKLYEFLEKDIVANFLKNSTDEDKTRLLNVLLEVKDEEFLTEEESIKFLKEM